MELTQQEKDLVLESIRAEIRRTQKEISILETKLTSLKELLNKTANEK